MGYGVWGIRYGVGGMGYSAARFKCFVRLFEPVNLYQIIIPGNKYHTGGLRFTNSCIYLLRITLKGY